MNDFRDTHGISVDECRIFNSMTLDNTVKCFEALMASSWTTIIGRIPSRMVMSHKG